MKKTLIALCLLLHISCNAQLILGNNAGDLIKYDFWLQNNNANRIVHGLSNATDILPPQIMPASMVTETELAAAIYTASQEAYNDALLVFQQELQTLASNAVAQSISSLTNLPVQESTSTNFSIQNSSSDAVLGISALGPSYTSVYVNFTNSGVRTWQLESTGYGDFTLYNSYGGIPVVSFDSYYRTKVYDLQLQNQATQETITPTHTLLLRDSTGTIYKLPVTPY